MYFWTVVRTFSKTSQKCEQFSYWPFVFKCSGFFGLKRNQHLLESRSTGVGGLAWLAWALLSFADVHFYILVMCFKPEREWATRAGGVAHSRVGIAKVMENWVFRTSALSGCACCAVCVMFHLFWQLCWSYGNFSWLYAYRFWLQILNFAKFGTAGCLPFRRNRLMRLHLLNNGGATCLLVIKPKEYCIHICYIA